jgi:acyl dehydratase
MPLNPACLGKTYPPLTTTVTRDATQNYARACNDDNPRYFDANAAGGIVAPPMFAAVVTWLSVLTVMTDAELHADLLRLLHSAQDMEFLAPIRPGDSITSTAKIASLESHQGGESMALELAARNSRGDLVNRTVFTSFIRGRRLSAPPVDSKAEPTSDRGAPLVTVAQIIDLDQTSRYAAASGDLNPIHVDANVAKMAGLPGIIVHGLCTMAFTAKVIVDNLCAGDPMRLKRLAVRFSRPVFPGDTITTRVWPSADAYELHSASDRRSSSDPDVLRSADRDPIRSAAVSDAFRTYTYETCNPDGLVVIRNGLAAVSS